MVKWQKLALWVGLGTLSIGAGITIAEFTNSDKMVSACEEAIQKRLKAPSAYKRINLRASERKLTEDEYKKYLDGQHESDAVKSISIRAFHEGDNTPKEFSYQIEYDAPNAFGTPIRSLSECTYISANGTKPDSYLFVSIDGQTTTDWLIDMARKSR